MGIFAIILFILAISSPLTLPVSIVLLYKGKERRKTSENWAKIYGFSILAIILLCFSDFTLYYFLNHFGRGHH